MTQFKIIIIQIILRFMDSPTLNKKLKPIIRIFSHFTKNCSSLYKAVKSER